MIKRFGDGRDWFFEKRFGMFVHWGLYAIPAWHEQVLWRTQMTRKAYEQLAIEFNPTKFDPEAWLDQLQEAGMQYLCFTTKHHDGFCMWDTAYTEYKITRTPYGRDVLGRLADACANRGIPLGLYYSLPDWHHANAPNWGRHHEMTAPRDSDRPDECAYLKYVRNQVTELLTDYGPIHAFFWDVNVAGYMGEPLNELIRALQPNAVINDRGPGEGDYGTPERNVPEGEVFDSPTEACQSMGRESWGYREDEDYYAHKFLMQSIDKVLAMGGNYLLNVGPKADGTLPKECEVGLKRIGKWYRQVEESYLGTQPCSQLLRTKSAGQFQDLMLMTRTRRDFYLHLYRDPETCSILVDCFSIKPERALLLNDGRDLSCVVDTVPWRWKVGPCLRVRGLPVDTLTDEVMVVKLEFGDEISDYSFYSG